MASQSQAAVAPVGTSLLDLLDFGIRRSGEQPRLPFSRASVGVRMCRSNPVVFALGFALRCAFPALAQTASTHACAGTSAPCTCAHCAHARIAHVRAHARTITRLHTHKIARTHKRTCAGSHVCMCAHSHAHSISHTHNRTQACMHTYNHTCAHAHTPAIAHAHTSTHVRVAWSGLSDMTRPEVEEGS